MFGHPFNGTIEKTARVTVNGNEVGQVRVDTATIQFGGDGNYVTAVTARRGALAAVPALHNFYEQHNACFPENPGDVHGFVNGLVFDGVPYVYHRHDKPTDNVIFRPLTGTETHTEGVQVTEHEPHIDAGGSGKYTAENWPNGGDKPDPGTNEDGHANPEANSTGLVPQGAAKADTPIYDDHPLTPTDIGGEGKPNFPTGGGLND